MASAPASALVLGLRCQVAPVGNMINYTSGVYSCNIIFIYGARSAAVNVDTYNSTLFKNNLGVCNL